jgi:hypothetical protein
LALLLLAACGGGGGGGDVPSGSKTTDTGGGAALSTLEGKVADGYLRDARVFLDRNGNRLYDNGEPTTNSTAGGAYSLEVNPGEGDLYPVVVEVIAGQTVDEDTGLTVSDDYKLEAPKGRWAFISPLTRMVKIVQEKNPSFTELQAVLEVRADLGINDNVSLFADYISRGTGGADAEVQTAAEYSRAHKAAQVVAALMGSLQADIEQNLGGQIADDEQAAVAYMISDKIKEQADVIKQALDDERNLAQPVDVPTLVNTTTTAIDSTQLDSDLLNDYDQRINQDLPTWDMQPPELVSRSPQANDSAPVDITIGIIFDEPLDETLIADDLISLNGPNGSLPGTVSYDAATKKMTFIPNQLLLPFSNYIVTLKKELTDSLGNGLTQDVTWSFTTIFDQLPPQLPDF